jgi:3-methyladenine DNA glycosylase/8-oxoguanine DNA glycosylase
MTQKKEMSVQKRALQLVEHVRSLPDMSFAAGDAHTHEHIGATITEAVLQAGLSYETVVRPRVERLRASYPEARTTSQFRDLLQRIQLDQFLRFSGSKPKLIEALTELLLQHGVETEVALRDWIQDPEHQVALKEIHGIGDKTVDYLKMLCGLSTAAIDVHLQRFLREAGVHVAGYADAQRVVHEAADVMGVDRGAFDRGIWKYMIERKSEIPSSRSRG